MKFRELPEFITTMYEEQADDDLRAIWLANPFKDSSYNDFKNKAIEEHEADNKPKELVEFEAKSGMDKALDLLNSLGGES